MKHLEWISHHTFTATVEVEVEVEASGRVLPGSPSLRDKLGVPLTPPEGPDIVDDVIDSINIHEDWFRVYVGTNNDWLIEVARDELLRELRREVVGYKE